MSLFLIVCSVCLILLYLSSFSSSHLPLSGLLSLSLLSLKCPLCSPHLRLFTPPSLQGLSEALYRLEDWHGLEELIYILPEGNELLRDVADKFSTVGMCEQAVKAYNKVPDVKESIATCVRLNQWDLAVRLANEHNVKEIDALLAKYAGHLLSKNKLTEAVELYRKAKHFLEAAKLLFQLAEEAAVSDAPPTRARQLYVLGAAQVEAHKDRQKDDSADPTRSALDGLLEEDALDSSYARLLEHPWHGAEAFHYFLLAQRQLYAGAYNDALRTAVRLLEYDDVLPVRQTSAVLALAAIATKNYALCSTAFVKMESQGGASASASAALKFREQVEALALDIFSRHPPRDAPPTATLACPKCETANPDHATSCGSCNFKFLASVASGRSMTDLEYWLCTQCKRRAPLNEIAQFKFCPLCHVPV